MSSEFGVRPKGYAQRYALALAPLRSASSSELSKVSNILLMNPASH
jgi:hypothetical protein